MKKRIKIFSAVLSLILLFTVVSPLCLNVDAKENADISSSNNDKFSYSISSEDSEWSDLSYNEQLESCNMQESLVEDYTTDELADLVLDYPFLIDILAFDNVDLAMDHFENTSNICAEFFSRDDAMDVLLEKYDGLNVNYELFDNTNNIDSYDVFKASGYTKELFLQSYFASKTNSMDKNETIKLKQILGEKYEQKKGYCDDYTTSLLFFDEIQKKEGKVDRDLIPDNIYNDLSTSEMNSNLSAFTSSGQKVVLTTGATFTVGTYTLYGKTVGCYQYSSGDYTTAEKNNIDTSFDSAHPSWTRNYSCTKKYNCHSYTWISSSSSNNYWLNNPDIYAGSSSFSYVGKNSIVSSGNKVIIQGSMSSNDGFGNYTYALHSLNVTSTGKTISKLGAIGVYTAPLADMFKFYSGFYWDVYK